MNTRFYFRKTDAGQEKQLKDYLDEKKLGRLTRLLRCSDPETADFEIRVEYSQRHNIFSINLTFIFTKHKLVSLRKSHNLIEAFDLAFDCLVFQMRKIESVKHDVHARS
jgi:ribosome-associated translation inhibitor RaiA